MSCSTCNKVAPIMSMGRSGLDYTLTPGVTYVTTYTGQNLPISAPLVSAPHGPIGGWGVRLFINSQQAVIQGRSATEVYSAAALLLDTNGISFTPQDLWLNLNIQWLQNQVAKYRVVKLEELLSLAVPVEYSAPEGAHQNSRWLASDWSPKAWGILELYLIEEPYNYARFINLVEELQALYNPSKCPTTGDGKLHIQLIHLVEKLRNFPAYTLPVAREWLWFAETQIGITDTNLETFSKNNRWL